MTVHIDQVIEFEFERSPSSARIARRAVMRLVGDAGSVEFVQRAALLTSELVSNATVHTAGPGRLRAHFSGRSLRVEVSDSSDVIPTPGMEPAPTAVGGRGLRLIAELSIRWGSMRLPRGKTVWFEIDT